MTNQIQILVNGQSHLLGKPFSLDTLLHHLKIDPTYIAIAVNEEILPRSELVRKIVQNGDRIEIIRAVAGG